MTLSKAFNKNSYEWRYLVEQMKQRKTELTERLISKDDEQVRGRIKMIDEFLSLEYEDSEPAI